MCSTVPVVEMCTAFGQERERECLMHLNEVHNVQCSCKPWGYWMSSGEILNHQQAALLELEFLIYTCGGARQVVVLRCGTGSGCVAALRLGRDTTGIDNSPFQLNEACWRLKQFGMAEAAEIAC